MRTKPASASRPPSPATSENAISRPPPSLPTNPAQIPELLAPAGSMEALKAAVAAGADAVYLGGTRFSARRFAANFDDDTLREAVEYAHAREVAVHVTVNTLVHDAELPALAEYLLFLYEIGVDAVLVQDVGVLRLARALVPGLAIHASTQMTITTAEGVRWAAEAGCSRVVLAREVSLAEIEAMRPVLAETGCELEVFLHGALCYAYSGQCLLSSVIGGRSGNRGACAQPCRKPYTLMKGDYDRYGRPEQMKAVRLPHRYLLSTKDICLYPVLDRVLAAPVSSLKIEGRMKSPAYVAVVTAIYRRALDAIAKGRWSPSPEDEEALAFAFTRGFTTGYLCGERHRGVIGPERPDNRGVAIGRVVAFSKNRMEATVALSGSLAPENGDGIAVSSPDGEFGCVVRGTPKSGRDGVQIRLPQPAPKGAFVSITRRAALESRAGEILRQERQAIRIDAAVRWEEDGTPIIEAVCTPSRRRPVRVAVRGPGPMEKARTRPLTADQISEQLRRTGGTPYVVGDLDLAYPGGLFAPPSYLNALRRSLLEAAGQALCEEARPPAGEIAAVRTRLFALLPLLKARGKTAREEKPVLSVYTDTVAGVAAASTAGAGRIYFEPAECTAEALAGAVSAAAGVPLIWKWPKIVRHTFLDAALPFIDPAAEAGVAGIMVEGHGCANAVRAALPRISLYGASGLNIWNAEAVAAHEDFALLTLSPELSRDDIRALVARLPDGAPAVEVVVQGVVEAMVTEDCPPATSIGCPVGCSGAAFGIRDEKGMTFPIRPAGECRTSIGNAVETCLLDHLPSLIAAGVGGIAIDARRRGPIYAREMVGIYRDALVGRIAGDLKVRAKALSLGGITAGAFVHGTE